MLRLEAHTYAGIFAGAGSWFAIYAPQECKLYEFKHDHQRFSERDQLEAFVTKNAARPGCIINCSADPLDQLWQQEHVKVIINLKLKQGQAFDYICNRDHTIRWLYPSGLTYPSFLSLYNGTGWMAGIYTAGFKWSYRLGLGRWVRSGQCHVRFKADAALSLLMDKMNGCKPAAFTGTSGQNRKAVISFSKKGQAVSFVKVPLTPDATMLVSKEREVLEQLSTSSPQHFTCPSIIDTDEAGLHISNVKPAKTYPVSQLTDSHLLALQESCRLYNKTSSSLGKSIFWQEVKNDIASLSGLKAINNLDPIRLSAITFRLKERFSAIDSSQEAVLSLAHGDFTPWNSFFDGQKIHTYDWELSAMLPVLYDAFHFIFQSSILIHRQDFPAIKRKIVRLAQHPVVQSMAREYQFDFQLCYRLYLLKTIAYYLPRYIRQDQLHEQAHWLMEVWLDALDEWG
jgi:hypothetical protein